MLPPLLVVEIPVDRDRDTGIEGVLRLPAELGLDLRRVHRIAEIVARSVLYILDEGLRLTECLQDGLHDLEVGALVVSANVVDLTWLTLPDDQVDGLAVIGDIEPVTYIYVEGVVYRNFRICLFLISGAWPQFQDKHKAKAGRTQPPSYLRASELRTSIFTPPTILYFNHSVCSSTICTTFAASPSVNSYFTISACAFLKLFSSVPGYSLLILLTANVRESLLVLTSASSIVS